MILPLRRKRRTTQQNIATVIYKPVAGFRKTARGVLIALPWPITYALLVSLALAAETPAAETVHPNLTDRGPHQGFTATTSPSKRASRDNLLWQHPATGHSRRRSGTLSRDVVSSRAANFPEDSDPKTTIAMASSERELSDDNVLSSPILRVSHTTGGSERSKLQWSRPRITSKSVGPMLERGPNRDKSTSESTFRKKHVVVAKYTDAEESLPPPYIQENNAEPEFELSQLPSYSEPETIPAPRDQNSSTPQSQQDIFSIQQYECAQLAEKLRKERLDSISLKISLDGVQGTDYPIACETDTGTYVPRQFATTVFEWKASNVCHKPLYFEQVGLERYGHTTSIPMLSPVVASAHFFASVSLLPYKMGMNPPWECIYPLGHYRPGSCSPYMIPAFPLSVRGGLLQAGAVTGLVAGFP